MGAKKRQTFEKRNRERAVLERRARKQEKKDQRKLDAQALASGETPATQVDDEQAQASDDAPAPPADDEPQPTPGTPASVSQPRGTISTGDA